jgi:hypothetical protein
MRGVGMLSVVWTALCVVFIVALVLFALSLVWGAAWFLYYLGAGATARRLDGFDMAKFVFQTTKDWPKVLRLSNWCFVMPPAIAAILLQAVPWRAGPRRALSRIGSAVSHNKLRTTVVLGYLLFLGVSSWTLAQADPQAPASPGTVIACAVSVFGSVLLPFTLVLAAWLYAASGYAKGSQRDYTHDWVFAGSQSKYRDASVSDVYDHLHGAGAYDRMMTRKKRILKFLGLVLGLSLPIVLLNFVPGVENESATVRRALTWDVVLAIVTWLVSIWQLLPWLGSLFPGIVSTEA